MKGSVRSCGCLHREQARINGIVHGSKGGAANVTHGYTRGEKRAPEYPVWTMMKRRCKGMSSAQDRELYHDRGITYCERWESFENFIADMGPRPSSKHTLDRINNDGNYEPSNCRWATQKEQANNRRPRRTRRALQEIRS